MDVSEPEITPEVSEPNPQPIADEISEPEPQTVTAEVAEPKPQAITADVVSEPATADVVSVQEIIAIADVVSEPEPIPIADEVSEPKPEPMEVELPVKTETELGSEDVSSDSISEEVPESSEKKEEETHEEDDGEDGNRPSKKQKSTEAETETDTAKTPEVEEVIAAVNSNGAKKASKKKSKNINSVWTKTTSRKKKKAKNFNGGGGGGGGAGGVGTSGGINAPMRKAEDAVKIMPLPRFPDKNDDSIDAKICLSKVYKAEKVELSDDRMSAGSCKGYRMVRATRGVSEGAWFFEIKVVSLGETGHTRLGWSTEKGDLQAPVGYDGCSFGFRDVDGSKVHKALREKYGEEGYKEGDVIGCYISLPEGESFAPKPPQLVCYKGQKYAYANDSKEDPPKIVPGSEISFFKNGICQGVAFKDLCGGRYYPAASMYTLPNQPNCVVKFNFGPDFEFFPADFEGRQIPRPMIEVPYHGYDGRVENGVLDESKQ